jgi:hypothetical protein
MNGKEEEDANQNRGSIAHWTYSPFAIP